MAFSESPITVQRMMPYLGPLIEGRETLWRTEPNRSKWFAYRVREALFAARMNPTQFPELAAARFRVEVLSSREVRAKPRPSLEESAQTEVVPQSVARMETGDVGSAEQIIAHWEGLSAAARTKVYFPNADLHKEDLKDLWAWACEAEVLVFENLGAITLLPKIGNEEAADYAFNPSDLEGEPSYE